MKSHNIMLKIGGAATVVSSLALAGNFINMYSLVSKCPESINVQPCRAYDNWITINTLGFMILILGIVFLILGLLRRYRNKS